MFTSTLRPISRQASLTSRRFLSTPPPLPRPSNLTRNALIATTFIAGAYVLTSESQILRAETRRPVRALEQPSVKEPIHKPTPEEAPELIQEKEKEASGDSSQGAFNEETGEINWDCPCLGGMATGPCGEEFKAAFSCFVYSEQEPKGMECVEKFKGMQDCFRLHPDIYGEEIEDDDGEEYDFPRDENGQVESPEPKSQRDGLKLPNAEPPADNPAVGETHKNNPAKGVEKLQPSGNRADKKPGEPSPTHGDGSA